MAAPHFLSFGNFCANHDRIIGPLVAALALIAATEVMRPLRWVVLAFGAWLVIAPLALGYWSGEPLARNNDMITGLICMIASSFRGRIESRFGGGWSQLWPGKQGKQQHET